MLRRRERNAQLPGLKEPLEINGEDYIYAVAFFGDGKQIVSGGDEHKIRRWRVKDGKDVGTVSMNAGGLIRCIAVSPDAKWIVSGTTRGQVAVWEAKSGKKATEFTGHSFVRAVDIAPDGARLATGSADNTARVWSLPGGKQLLDPFVHDYPVSADKFSPDGLSVATATWQQESVRVYDSRNGNLLVDQPIKVGSLLNNSLAWASNSDQLFALSGDGNVICLEVPNGTTISRWPTHSTDPRCIALASNEKFIAVSGTSSVSFWDTATRQQIGSAINHTPPLMQSMAISTNFDIAMAGDKAITLRSLRGVLPSRYFDATPTQNIKTGRTDPEAEGLHTSIATLRLIYTSVAALASWRKDRLLEAIDIVSREGSTDQLHHMLATRAFLRARLRQWSFARKDAQKAIDIRPTALAYVALSMVWYGQGNEEAAQEMYNRLLRKCIVYDAYFILLIKAVVIFTSRCYQEGLSRVAELIVVCPKRDTESYCAVQMYMRLITAKAYIGQQEYEMALESLTHLKDPACLQFPKHPQMECITLMFGWMNDSYSLRFMLYQQQCEALFGLGRREDAAVLLRTALKDLEGTGQVHLKKKEVEDWSKDFRRRCPMIAPEDPL